MMVNSWIRNSFIYLKNAKLILIHHIPHLLNNASAGLDQCFVSFSTEVDEKRVRKTILSPVC
jgi:hypothetical protein